MSKNVLVVAPHPDDETLGCGGTILNHKESNDNVFWLLITKANQAITDIPNIVEKQKSNVEKVNVRYGFEKLFHLDFLTTELERYPIGQLISEISKIINETKPEIIYLPHCSDIHSDHSTVFQATISCTKNFRYPFIKKVLMYETLSETEFAPALSGSTFIPNVFVDITNHIDKKIEIMKLFTTEIMEFPLPRSFSSIKALARLRGSRIGVEYAEAFQLLLEII